MKYKRILLIGDYSGVYYEIWTELRKRGYEVLLFSSGDGYKGFKYDFYINVYYSNSKIYKICKGILDLIGIKGLFIYIKNYKIIKKLVNFDIVQIINPIAVQDFGSIANFLFLRFIFKNNKKIFLSALGDDYAYVKYCLSNKFEYSGLKSYGYKELGGFSFEYLLNAFYSLKYVYGIYYSNLNKFVLKNVTSVIPGTSDYFLAYYNEPKLSKLVPLPINLRNYKKPEIATYPVKIFIGIQKGKNYRKGYPFFLEAIERLKKKYSSEIVEFRIVESVPFEEYLTLFENSDIFLDQCLGHGIGVNAVLGLAKGKVVFSGIAPIFDQNVDVKISVNVGPNTVDIFNKLCVLIENLELLNRYKINAYKYAVRYNNIEYVTNQYLEIWEDKK